MRRVASSFNFVNDKISARQKTGSDRDVRVEERQTGQAVFMQELLLKVDLENRLRNPLDDFFLEDAKRGTRKTA